MSKVAAIIVAGGYGFFNGPRGQRISKVTAHLYPGKALICHLAETLTATGLFSNLYVVINQDYAEQIKAVLSNFQNISYAVQPHRLGSAGAVKIATDLMGSDENHAAVAYADMPLISARTFKKICDRHLSPDRPKITLLSIPYLSGTAIEDYGRIIWNSQGQIACTIDDPDYVPAADLTVSDRVNPSVYGLDVQWFRSIYSRIPEYKKPHEHPAWPPPERLMQSAVKIAYQSGQRIAQVESEDYEEVLGVNKLPELRHVRQVYRRRAADPALAYAA